MAMIGRFRRYAREHGVRETISRALLEVGRLFFHERHLTIMSKSLDSISAPRKRSGLMVTELDRDELPGLSELNRKRGRSEANRRFRDNLDRGLHGFVARRDGITVGYYWWIECERAAAHPDLDWLGEALNGAADDVYGSDLYILPEGRSSGTANEFLFEIETAIRRLGFKRIWGYVDSGNPQARWLYSSRGYMPIREVTRRRVLFWRQTIYPPG